MATKFGKATVIGVAALMLAGVGATAQGFSSPISSPLQAGRLIQVKGKIVCTGCNIEEARKVQRDKYQNHLYQVIHKNGKLVIELNSVNRPEWFNNLATPHLWIRGEDGQLQQLSVPENLTKEVAFSAIATNVRTLDVTEITIQ